MFSHEVEIPAGFAAAVNFQIVPTRPLYAHSRDQVHFVSFAPSLTSVATEAVCREGVTFRVSVDVRMQIPSRENCAELLRLAGHSTRANPVKISAQEVAARANLAQSFTAAIKTFIRESAFFDLSNPQAVRNLLGKAIEAECAAAHLAGQVVGCDAVAQPPTPDVLSQIAARAGMTEEDGDDGARIRSYADPALGSIVEFFLSAARQKERIAADAERARGEAEIMRVQMQQQLTRARADLKITEAQENERVKRAQAEVDARELDHQQQVQERHARIKETNATYEFEYRRRRIEDDMRLAEEEQKLAAARAHVEAHVREQRRQDMLLELERERELAQLRAQEHQAALVAATQLIAQLKDIQPPDYSGVQTLMTDGADPRDRVFSVVMGLVGALGLPGGHDTIGNSDRRPNGGRLPEPSSSTSGR